MRTCPKCGNSVVSQITRVEKARAIIYTCEVCGCIEKEVRAFSPPISSFGLFDLKTTDKLYNAVNKKGGHKNDR